MNPFRAACVVLSVVYLLTLVGLLAMAGGPKPEQTDAHKYADGVLLPRFSAAMNDWAWQHPQDAQGQPGSHVHTISVGDVKRLQVVRQAFKEWDDAMKRAGY